jgi:4-amino-4-deoxy-L-arabinose transferase-like glycosyltransferase
VGPEIRRSFALPLLILCLAWAVRLAPWNQYRFLEDEALYSYWGLQIATGQDLLLDGEPIDKPPLHPYLLALSLRLLAGPDLAGPAGLRHEAAARFPSLAASLVSVALVFALGRQVSGSAFVGLVASLFLALSPFDSLFASTAFTDPMLTMFVLAALLAAKKEHLGMAGLFAGLACATKQQAILFLPLILLVAFRPSVRERSLPARRLLSYLLRFFLPLAIVAAGILCWDAARVQRPGFVQQSLISYGGLRLAPLQQLTDRAVAWLQLLNNFWGGSWPTAVLTVVVIVWLLGGLCDWWSAAQYTDWALSLFFVAFLVVHWLLSFQVWDRYLLGLVPLASLLVARSVVALGALLGSARWPSVWRFGTMAVAVLVLLLPASTGARAQLPVGGDHGAYDGIDQIATYMREVAPPGSVLYHHWLGYHYRFYLYAAPLRFHWYPSPDELVHDATVYRREPRYIAFPCWHDSRPIDDALAHATISLEPVLEARRRDGTTSFRLYRLLGPPARSSQAPGRALHPRELDA